MEQINKIEVKDNEMQHIINQQITFFISAFFLKLCKVKTRQEDIYKCYAVTYRPVYIGYL